MRPLDHSAKQNRVLPSDGRTKAGALAKRGLEQQFVTNLGTLYTQALELQKTSALDEVLESLAVKVSEAKKVVKLDLPQEAWKEFGIQDAR